MEMRAVRIPIGSAVMNSLIGPAIQAPLNPPELEPKDKKLLRPLKSLGQPKTSAADISFLRRTQYTADERSRLEGGGSRNLGGANIIKKKPKDLAKEDPRAILRAVIKGFDIANPGVHNGPDTEEEARGAAPTLAEREAWRNPKHPSNPSLKVIATYPLLPDPEGTPADAAYIMVKLGGNPTEKTTGHDTRLDVGILKPEEPSPDMVAAFQAQFAAHQANPERNPAPKLPTTDVQLFLSMSEEAAFSAKQALTTAPEVEDDDHASKAHRFVHTRFYTPTLVATNEDQYHDIALVVHDQNPYANATGSNVSPVAYFYPVAEKQQLKPRRAKHLAQLGTANHIIGPENPDIDALDVIYRVPGDEELARQEVAKDVSMDEDDD